MARLLRPIAAGATLLVYLSASVLAQTAESPLFAMKPQKVVLSPAELAARKAKAKECSAKADAKGLHGKARLEFREKCKKS